MLIIARVSVLISGLLVIYLIHKGYEDLAHTSSLISHTSEQEMELEQRQADRAEQEEEDNDADCNA